ncbi:hypothetical protein [Micromonospora gifhornensis]|uniref:hypothetical protein n=1 Tax=Micromonospora gifhornensis TaxID=84594 RepID=UPI003D734BA2
MIVPDERAGVLERLVAEQAGVLTVAQARTALGERAVRGLVRSGRWRSISRGLLLAGSGRLTREQQLWVAVLAAGSGAVLAGATAAIEAGVRGLRIEPVHVLVPSARRPGRRSLRGMPIDMAAVAVHRTTVLPAAHLEVGRPPRTIVARALVDAAGWASSARQAQEIVAGGCQQGRVSPEELAAVLEVLPRAPRRQVIRQSIDGLAQAYGRIEFVRCCRRAGLPEPELSSRRTDGSGRAGWWDAYWRAWRVHVEIDGTHQGDVRDWVDVRNQVADLEHQNDISTTGDRVLQFPAWLVRTHPDQVADTVRRALLAGGWGPDE